jgi:DNA modification methylase
MTAMTENRVLTGDSLAILKTLSDQSADCCVTSPPYFNLRDYSVEGQIGTEDTPGEYIGRLAAVFHEVCRVLKDAGTLWVVIGDSYSNKSKRGGATGGKHARALHGNTKIGRKKIFCELPDKSLAGVPWRLAFALQADGWILRQDIIWAKTNPMPESVKDRFCRSHEYMFLFSKQKSYFFDTRHALEEAVGYEKHTGNNEERGYKTKTGVTGLPDQFHGSDIMRDNVRTKRDVWFISTEPSTEEHYAMFPQKLITPCVLCGCPENGVVLDPFMGSGTTAVVAMKHTRKFIGCEINPEYVRIAEKRIAGNVGLWNQENML